MSFGLVDEVFEHAPADLTAAERLLLVCIARAAQDEDRSLNGRRVPARTCFPGREKLKQWTGLNDRGLSDALLRLSKRGLEVRIPVSVDKSDRPVFAARGHATEFLLPVLKGHATAGPSEAKGLATAGPTASKAHATASESPRHSVGKVAPQRAPKDKEPKLTLPPSPQSPEPLAPASVGTAAGGDGKLFDELTKELLGRFAGTAPDDAREIVRRCLEDVETKFPASRLRLPAYVASLHSAVKAERAAARRTALAAGAKCEDHPESVAAHCPGCMADVKCGQRDRQHIGRKQPECVECYEPIVGQPDGAKFCKQHALENREAAA
ncbi:hypothetical protein J2W14_000520 [Pseudarthrobacter oxydans]|nr:hypothetical protein [Pseudarthrobacter oxydans]